MKRVTGTYTIPTTSGEPVPAFVPHPLPPIEPVLAAESYTDLNHQAELALARLSGVSGLVPSVDWLLYSAIRKEALLTSENWIDGRVWVTRLFLPPPAERLTSVLGDLEQFIHDERRALLPLVRIARAHAQFETIYPFP